MIKIISKIKKFKNYNIFSTDKEASEMFSLRLKHYHLLPHFNGPSKLAYIVSIYNKHSNIEIENEISQVNTYYPELNLQIIYLEKFLIENKNSNKAEKKIDKKLLKRFIYKNDFNFLCYNMSDFTPSIFYELNKTIKKCNKRCIVTRSDSRNLCDMKKSDIIIIRPKGSSYSLINYIKGNILKTISVENDWFKQP